MKKIKLTLAIFSMLVFGFFLSKSTALVNAQTLQTCYQSCVNGDTSTAGSTAFVNCTYACDRQYGNSGTNSTTTPGSGTGQTGGTTGGGGLTCPSGYVLNGDACEPSPGSPGTTGGGNGGLTCPSGYVLNGDACEPTSAGSNADTSGVVTNPNDYVGGSSGTSASCSGEKIAGVCFPSGTGLSESDVGTIISNFLSWALGIFGVLALIAFVVSGIQYLVSAGNEDMIKTAKRNMTYSIIGVVVALSGFVIIQAIDAALNASSTAF